MMGHIWTVMLAICCKILPNDVNLYRYQANDLTTPRVYYILEKCPQ